MHVLKTSNPELSARFKGMFGKRFSEMAESARVHERRQKDFQTLQGFE